MEEKQEVMEQQEEGVSLGRFFKVVFHKWKLFLIVTGGVTLVGSLGLVFGYNKLVPTYTSTFTYKSIVASGDVAPTEFTIDQFSSETTLNEIGAKFGTDVNVAKMIKDKSLQIKDAYSESENIQNIISTTKSYYDDENVNRQLYVTTTTYKVNLTVPVKYFKDDDTAVAFVKELAQYPSTKFQKIIDTYDFDAQLKIFDEADNSDDKIDALIKQYKSILNYYEVLNHGYDKYALEDTSHSIDTYLGKFKRYFVTNSLEDLKKLSDQQGLVYADDMSAYEEKLKDKAILLKASYDENNEYINTKRETLRNITADVGEGTGPSGNASQIVSDINKLTDENTEKAIEYASIQKKINFDTGSYTDIDGTSKTFTPPETSEIESFKKSIDEARVKLEGFTEDFKLVKKDYVTGNQKLSFDSSDVVTTNKYINPVLCILISLLVGFVVAIIVNAIVDRKYFHNPLPNEVSSSPKAINDVKEENNNEETKEETSSNEESSTEVKKEKSSDSKK